jgi:cyclase
MIRIIPRLDIKGSNLVKGIHLEGLRVLGKPEDFARYYYENKADELIFQDVVASLYDRNSLHEIIKKTSKRMFIPLTVGGGLRTVEDIRLVLRAGADKVTLNTAAIRNPNLLKDASLKFGSSTIVVAIEAIKQPNGNYYAFTDNGREETGVEVVRWAKHVQDLGAGEILITSVDKDGTNEGYDIDLVRLINDAVSIPVIAHGGAGPMLNLSQVAKVGISGLAIASSLHYSSIEKIKSNSELEGNTMFLRSGEKNNKIISNSILEIKSFLISQGFDCRPI